VKSLNHEKFKALKSQNFKKSNLNLAFSGLFMDLIFQGLKILRF
jgi:hypothetical protein